MSTQEASNQKSISFQQRLFARFMASEDEKSHELYKNKKVELFSQLTGTILEIGPGYGNLTKSILKMNPKKIIAIEKDKNLALYLNNFFKSKNKIEIINDDILNIIIYVKTRQDVFYLLNP